MKISLQGQGWPTDTVIFKETLKNELGSGSRETGKGLSRGAGLGNSRNKGPEAGRVEDFGRSGSLVTAAVVSADLRGVARGEGLL